MIPLLLTPLSGSCSFLQHPRVPPTFRKHGGFYEVWSADPPNDIKKVILSCIKLKWREWDCVYEITVIWKFDLKIEGMRLRLWDYCDLKIWFENRGNEIAFMRLLWFENSIWKYLVEIALCYLPFFLKADVIARFSIEYRKLKKK